MTLISAMGSLSLVDKAVHAGSGSHSEIPPSFPEFGSLSESLDPHSTDHPEIQVSRNVYYKGEKPVNEEICQKKPLSPLAIALSRRIFLTLFSPSENDANEDEAEA